MTKRHYPIKTERTEEFQTGQSATQVTVYICPCGYRSLNSKEFVSVNNPSTKGVTCEGALEYIFGSVAIVTDTEEGMKT